ncbi:MAG: hypothetical protein M3Q16_09385, partial [Pseudomonadota bacterium]|nr:hypothetical protein [Pseudomonadota bacterium]
YFSARLVPALFMPIQSNHYAQTIGALWQRPCQAWMQTCPELNLTEVQKSVHISFRNGSAAGAPGVGRR